MKYEKFDEELLCDKVDSMINELTNEIQSLEKTFKLFNLSEENHNTIQDYIEVVKCKLRKLEKAKYREDVKKVLKLTDIYLYYQPKDVG